MVLRVGAAGPGGGGGSGTVTSVSVVSANGFSGTVANATTTPAITVRTTITGILSGNGTAISAASTTGSGAVVLATSPTLVTPVLGVAAATSINKVALTEPASAATLTIADGKTLTANNSITLAGTDATTMTFPATSATIARIDAAQTFVTGQIVNGTLRLGTVSSATGQLLLANSASANLTTIQAGNASAARTYTWPTDFGAAGSVLTDAGGDGTLSWAAASGGITQLTGDVTAGPGSGSVAATLATTQPGAHTWQATQTFTPTANTEAIVVSGYSLTGSNAQSALSIAGTWNTTGTPTAFKLNLTDTASNAASLLMDLQVGGASLVNVRKDGVPFFLGSAMVLGSSGTFQLGSSGSATTFRVFPRGDSLELLSGEVRLPASILGFSTGFGVTPDVILRRDAANVLALRNGTAAQTLRWYHTFTDLSNRQNGALLTAAGYVEIAAETAGTGADNVDIRLTPAGTGAVNLPGGDIFLRTRAAITSGPGAGAGTLTNAPSAGDPDVWIPIDNNGTTVWFPAWAA